MPGAGIPEISPDGHQNFSRLGRTRRTDAFGISREQPRRTRLPSPPEINIQREPRLPGSRAALTGITAASAAVPCRDSGLVTVGIGSMMS